MDEALSLDTTSVFSSIAEAPVHLHRQYSPLEEVFQSNSTALPDHHMPEPNSEAMVKALKALQEKIRGLELDRLTAAEKFQHLSEETQDHTLSSDSLDHARSSHSSSPSPPAYPILPPSDTHDLRRQLSRIDAKFSDQAHELEEMKERLQLAEATREQGVACSQLLEQQHRELLRQQRKILQHVAKTTPRSIQRAPDQSQSQPKAQRHSVHKCHHVSPVKQTTHRRRKVDYCTCEHTPSLRTVSHCKPIPGIHYRLNLRDLPFLLGTSVSPSHSVTGNYQQVLASMKSHSSLLCGAAAAAAATPPRNAKKCKKCHKCAKSKSSASTNKLESLLAGLEEEFGHLTFEHQELARQLQEQSDPSRVSQFEKQIERLVDQMESKAEQINTVTKELHAAQVKSRKVHRAQDTSHYCSPRAANLKLLQKMKALQSTLQQDDLHWD